MKETIKRCARLASLVYPPFPDGDDLEELSRVSGYENVVWLDKPETDTQVLMAMLDDDIYITFRGTEFKNLDDWRTNFDCELVPWCGGNVHRGFFKDVQSVMNDILSYIEGVGKYNKMVVTGHSQGGGDALIAFIEFDFFKHHNPYCVTFGGPRVMDKLLAKKLPAGRIHRIVNNNDIVARIPPRWTGYRHPASVLWYFKETGELVHGIAGIELFADRLHGWIADLFEPGIDILKDHKISEVSEYRRLVEAM